MITNLLGTMVALIIVILSLYLGMVGFNALFR